MSRILRCFLPAVLALAAGVRAQLPAPWVPPQNPLTPEKAILGKILFWDEQLSSDDSTACGTCHQPAFGGSDPRSADSRHPGLDGAFGTDDDIHGSLGVHRQKASGAFRHDATFAFRRQVTKRVANTHLGAAYAEHLFWDMRASSEFVDPETGEVVIPFGGALESQAVAPIVSAVEMARDGRTWQQVRAKLQAVEPLALAANLPSDVQAALQQNPTYPLLFAAAFGDPTIDARRIAFALASYQRTQIPDDTPWDRFVGGQPAAMTPAEQQGWILFQGAGRCTACHWDPLFTDNTGHVLGLRPISEDRGISLDIGVVADLASFKTPTLRNAGLRPRLFHNGQSPALGDPAQFTDPASTLNVYLAGGGVDSTNLDAFLLPLGDFGVTVADMALIQDFVRTALTDARCAQRLPPFDHPDLRSMVLPPPRVFGQSLPGANEPFLIDSVPSYPGNTAWRLGAVGGNGTTLALGAVGLSSIEPTITVLGVPWNLQPLVANFLLLQGPQGAPAVATWHLPLPDAPWLAQIPFYFQTVVIDPTAPFGIAASRGTEIFVR